jgi:hypothetical protein
MNHTEKGTCCHGGSDIIQENGQTCGGCGCGHHQAAMQITESEAEFLNQLAQTPYLPLTRFVLKSTKSDHFESVALAPVYLISRSDSMEMVKSTGIVLKSLEGKGLITLDYDEPLENGNYNDYLDSELYAFFKETAAQAKDNNDFLFDIPDLELGSIALTSLGQTAIIELDKLNRPEMEGV